ncbi:hypothetical protein [Paenibacillus sp. S150]|uniref:hypothetical protein n=1 Tax=Paenibacillus sp. S150 TaxID=2749826 RepID=UPI001C55FBC4|nr:hypothetical protein [Paenibacillus sp. S150]MBW4082408.1 hypothetical protein [Paenibacillus sp. S150]
MELNFVVYGSWKIRHNEPMQLDDKQLALFPLRIIPEERESILLKTDSSVDFQSGIVFDGPGEESEHSADMDPDWFLTHIPLAVLVRQENVIRVTHLTLRVEEGFIQLVRNPGNERVPDMKSLGEHIYNLYEQSHLYLSNHECYYIKANETTELEQKFHFGRHLSYWRAHQEIFEAFDRGEFPGYTLKLGDEYQSWSFDNYLYELKPDAQEDRGYISAIHYCKRKNQWNDPLYMFKKKIYSEDTLERWEKNYENQWIDQDVQMLLEDYFGYSTEPLPPWRRTRSDIGVESANGNIFMVNIDDCRVLGESGATPWAKLQQCEIEYMSTRGIPDEEKVYADFHRLTALVEQFFILKGWQPQSTYYSKLTFLKDYVNQSSKGAPA